MSRSFKPLTGSRRLRQIAIASRNSWNIDTVAEPIPPEQVEVGIGLRDAARHGRKVTFDILEAQARRVGLPEGVINRARKLMPATPERES